MADVNPIDRQEIVQAALEKAFKKLAKKGGNSTREDSPTYNSAH